ncbi:MAG TPA: cation:proton antiporter [Kiritimatiellia bacterium]|nr:cation:proton antiporter [Kiritimatiellia bacterium]
MHGASFLQDLAVVMLVAGIVTLIFHHLKQPVVLGYLLAGFIVGPFTPPFPLIENIETIQIMADLGVVFLMFALGLEFNLRKLHKVGRSALGVAVIEISVMMGVGYLLGYALGWAPGERVFLGIMLSLTSTTIVIKSLRDRHDLKKPYAELISGVSIFDDVFVIFVMILLPSVALTGSLPTQELLLSLGGLLLFLVAVIVVGLIVVPRLLKHATRFRSDEMMLILVLALCFGVALLAVKLNFSTALGAFLIGAIMAESRESMKVVNLTGPIRDMFLAVFFVSIGMLIEPRYVFENFGLVLLVLVVYFPFKIASCSLAAYLFGLGTRDAVRVGTNMAQIGEFTFILGAIAMQLDLIGGTLYPVIVSAAAVNALFRPYLVDASDKLADAIARRLPKDVKTAIKLNRKWITGIRSDLPVSPARRMIRSVAIQIGLNIALIASVFVAAAIAYGRAWFGSGWLPSWMGGTATLVWGGAVVLTLPVYIATVKKMQALTMMVTDVLMDARADSARKRLLGSILSSTMLVVQYVLLAVVTLIVSSTLLPPLFTLVVMLGLVAGAITLFGRDLNRWYSRGKFALLETFSETPVEVEAQVVEKARVPHDLLKEATLRTALVSEGSGCAGKLIRELELRSQYGVSVVAIRRAEEDMINPGPDVEIRKDDMLLLLGSPEELEEAIGAVDPARGRGVGDKLSS